MRYVTIFLIASSALFAQNPIVDSSKGTYAIVKDDVLRSAEKVPENLWSFQPTAEIRTWAQLIAHQADGQYEFCGAVSTVKPVVKDVEKTMKTKAEIIAALKESFAYCDAVWAKMTDSDAGAPASFFGQKMAKIAIMNFNTAHTFEHYGNMVTYMRLKGIVPASSEPRK